MPTRELLAPSQRVQFTNFTAPLDDRTLARFYTLSDTDLELIRRHRRDSTQLGFAVQLGYARLPGRVLRVGEEAHPQIVATLARQLGVDPRRSLPICMAVTPPAVRISSNSRATSAFVHFQP